MKMGKAFAACLAAAGMVLLGGCGDSIEDEFEMYAGCLDIGQYEAVEYVPASREVTQDDIDAEIDSFCDENSETSEDYDSVIEEGDTVNIIYTETISGEEYDSYTDDDGYDIVIGDEELAEGLDEQLVGLTPGTETTLTVTYADDYEDTTLAGMEAEFDITINYISVTTVPEYTDDLVNTATEGEYTTTDDYTEYITEYLQEEADESADESDRTTILETIIDDSTFNKYPEEPIEEYITEVMTDIESTADSYGIDVETLLAYFYGYDNEADFVAYMQEVVESVMQERMVVCTIAIEKDLIATDEEISEYKAEIMEDYSIEESEVADYYSDFDLAFYATEEKVLDYLIESATQVDELSEDTEEDAEEEGDEDVDIEIEGDEDVDIEIEEDE